MKTLSGKVVKAHEQEKTALVEVVRETKHPLYKKILRISKKYTVDLSGIKVVPGDLVLISETRPVSKTKYFKVIKKISQSK